MIVDDETDILEFLKLGLERLGYRVEAYSDPRKALAVLTAGITKHDVLITDLTMPFMLGSELARKAKAVQPRIKVILSSGHTAERMISENVDDFFPKPVMMNDLSRRVRAVLTGNTAT